MTIIITFVEFELNTKGLIDVSPGQSQTIECQIDCPDRGNLTGCDIRHHWIATSSVDNFTKVNYLSTSRSTNELVQNNYVLYEITEISDTPCAVDETNTFSITFTYISPQLRELQVYCGVRRITNDAANPVTAFTPGVAILRPGKI